MSRSTAPRGRALEASPGGSALEQEVFFFHSGPDRIYGTLFAGAQAGDLPGMVVCPSWGFETYRLRDASYTLARRIAERGGAGFVFDWVGHGDSSGEPEDATLDRMIDVAGDALRHATGLRPSLDWGLTGIRLGACVAADVAARAGAKALLMLQPSLDPVAHFEEIRRAVRRASLGRVPDERWAFGSPLPDVATWGVSNGATRALEQFDGRLAAVRFTKPPGAPLPAGVEEIRVDGAWRTGLSGAARRDLLPLLDAATAWLERDAREAR
jgi:hypothetical protein